MYDKIETIGKSTIQHGKENDRIYLMKLSDTDYPDIIQQLEQISIQENYSKIFAKIKKSHISEFLNNDYQIEAHVPKFYGGTEDGYFLGKYVDKARKNIAKNDFEEIERNIQIAKSKEGTYKQINLPEEFEVISLTTEHAPALSSLYKLVFPSYPFPIHNPSFIIETMEENVEYFGIIEKHTKKLVAASSSEKYFEYKNVEMTDFATNPEYLGNGFALYLLDIMEKEMKSQGFKNLYTIARSHSAGMNVTFAKNNYAFAGTLINNTNIFGRIESMNVWYKLI